MMNHSHVALPKETHAFICANCGAVALDPENLCDVQGRGRKADWCGTKATKPNEYCRKTEYCRNKVHNERWQCRNCGQIAINPELLCEPEKLDIPV